MMAFRTTAPVVLDPLLTLASLLAAMSLALPGMAIAARNVTPCGAAGGFIIGGGIAIMHYIGMAAYRVDGVVTWDGRYVAASVALSCGLTAAAFQSLTSQDRAANLRAAGLLSLATAALHFTGTVAMRIEVSKVGKGLSALTMEALAVTTAVATCIIVGCAAISALIDGHTRHEANHRLRQMAMRDGLTDLPNRTTFIAELERRMSLGGGYQRMAVVMLDVSGFKVVNDTCGHQAGDQLLVALAARLEAMLDAGELIARLGGTEFAALVSYDNSDALPHFLDRLNAAVVKPVMLPAAVASIRANIGVALAIRDGLDADALLAKADLAMYRAKSTHSPQPCFYDARIDDAVRDRRELAADLRRSLDAGAFEIHYQVQADISSGEIKGYEALVRWHHPSRGTVPPGVFIPLAEESGDIAQLSIWILRQVCFEAALWPNRHPVAVNLSPVHLADPNLIDTVRSALAASGLAPERLSLELTESAIIDDRRFALDQLNALREMGIGIALDDFGVGYSSLDVLRSFPFDRIKLDASFVAEIEHDEQAVSILRSITTLGRTLKMSVLAEGIETPAQLAIVAREGCSAIQGYLIGRPSRSLADAEQIRKIMSLRPHGVVGDVDSADATAGKDSRR